ncbi:hypothetical protein [Alsobacter sp. R-9]
MLISIYGDSLAMPRVSEGISYRNTYGETARRQLVGQSGREVLVFNRSRPAVSIGDLSQIYRNDESYLAPEDKGVVIIQSGIVDCAPRPLPSGLRNMVSRLPTSLRTPIVTLLHKNRRHLLDSGLSWRLTDPEHYLKVLGDWVEHASSRYRLVIVVGILPVTAAINRHSPGFADSADAFDRLIDQAVRGRAENVVRLRLSDAIRRRAGRMERYVAQSDGHHLSAAGHEVLGRVLSRLIHAKRTLIGEGR